ncbi:MAG TPA: hypothetical protein VF741_04660 [Candidatus Aquilonibacter sp.]
MNDRDLLSAARRLLRELDDERALRANPLLCHLRKAAIGHDRLRAHILRALAQLDPDSRTGPESARRARQYTILLRCDIERAPHKDVAATLGLSRRQFYRDRRAALLAFATNVRAPQTLMRIETETHDARLLYIETLRDRGRHDLVWRESLRALPSLKGHPREIEIWTVAAEAARLLGNVRKSREVIETMRAVEATSPHTYLRRATRMRIAICEIALDWIEADFTSAQRRLEEAMRACGDERTLRGRDATLFGILLYYGARLALDTGDWPVASALTQRLEHIWQRSEVIHAAAYPHQLRGLLAMQGDGDHARAVAELNNALAISQTYHAFPSLALSSAELGLAIAPIDVITADRYIRYGLAIARDACGYDDFAALAMTAMRKSLPHIGAEEALEAVEEVRTRSPLFRRADLFTRLTESTALLHAGSEETLSGDELARELEQASLLPAAAEAYLVSAEALLRERREMAARRSLKRAGELIVHCGDAATRDRALALGARLSLALQ